MDVYLLWHMRPLEGQGNLDPECNHVDTADKLCGAYSTRIRAENARRQLVTQPDFRDYPDAFLIAEYEVDQIQWTEGFMPVVG